MATSSFDKVFVISDPEAQERLIKILESDEPGVPIDDSLYNETIFKGSEEQLRQLFSHVKS